MVGHKLGEFAPTRLFRGHTGEAGDKKAPRRGEGKTPSALPAAARRGAGRAAAREAGKPWPRRRRARSSAATRQSPYKMRLVIDQIRGKDVNEALALLKFSKKHAAKQIEKMLNSAVANAEQAAREDERVARRGRAVRQARDRERRAEAQAVHAGGAGRATPIQKRTSHIEIVVAARRGTLMGQKTNPIGFRLGISQAVALALVREPRAAGAAAAKTSCCGSISRRASGTRRSPTSRSSASRARSS